MIKSTRMITTYKKLDPFWLFRLFFPIDEVHRDEQIDVLFQKVSLADIKSYLGLDIATGMSRIPNYWSPGIFCASWIFNKNVAE